MISIVITEEDLIADSPLYHHRFTFYDPDAGVEFSDIIEIHTVELRKLPINADGTTLYDWAKFINAETEEELDMIAQRNPQVGKAVVKLRELSADERARDLFERREKGRRDAEAFADDARNEGRAEGRAEEQAEIVNNAIKMGMNIDAIAQLTGLSFERVIFFQKQRINIYRTARDF